MALSFWEHTKAELRLMAGAFVGPWLLTMLGVGLVYACVWLFGDAPPEAAEDPELPGNAVMVPLAFGYGAVVGFWPGVVVGGLRVSWKLTGPWTLVPLLLIPLALAAALYLASGLLARQGMAVLDAAALAAADHDWALRAIGKAAHAGPVVLVIGLPLLIFDLGSIAVQPEVLWTLAILVLTFVLVIAAAVVPTSLVSVVVMLRAYLLRLRERSDARNLEAASGLGDSLGHSGSRSEKR